MTEPIENVVEDTDNESAPILQKPKKKLSEKQKEIGRANLAKGREVLAEKKRIQKEEHQKLTDELVLKKAAKLQATKAKQEKKVKDTIGEDDTEVEEHIIKKPKRKKIVYREESDSEEEVIVRRKPREMPREVAREEAKQPQRQTQFRINFC